MRTKTIDGQECILACGGPGFKVYSQGDNWLIVKGKTKLLLIREHTYHLLVCQYVNLKYQSRSSQTDIMAEFDTFVQTI